MVLNASVHGQGAGMHKIVLLACVCLVCFGSNTQAQKPASQKYQIAQKTSISSETAEHDMQFTLSDIGIEADGIIENDTYKLFDNFLIENPSVKPGMSVHLTSPGGSVYGGLMLGHSFTQYGFDTFVGTPGQIGTPLTICASACNLAFVGGARRFVAANAQFEIHASRLVKSNGEDYGDEEKAFTMEDIAGTRFSDAQTIRYMRSRGIDPTLAACILDINPSNIMLVPPFLLRKWRVDNQDPTPLTTKQSELVQENDAHWENSCSVLLIRAQSLSPVDAATSH